MRTNNGWKLFVALVVMILGLFVVSLAFGQSVTEEQVRARAAQIEAAKAAEKAEKATRKADTPAMKQARKELEREARAEQEAYFDQARMEAVVSGCAPGTVWVSPRAMETSRWRVMATVDVVNTGTTPIDEIRAGINGVVVTNLCAGGSVTLSFILKWEDTDMVQIPLTAVSRSEKGVVTTQSSVYMNRYMAQYNRVNATTWQIHLR